MQQIDVIAEFPGGIKALVKIKPIEDCAHFHPSLQQRVKIVEVLTSTCDVAELAAMVTGKTWLINQIDGIQPIPVALEFHGFRPQLSLVEASNGQA